MRVLGIFFCFLLAMVAAHAPAAAKNGTSPASENSAYEAAIEAAKTEIMADPEKALSHSNRALELADKQSGKDKNANRASALWLKAESLLGLNRLDEAGTVATEALALIEQAQPNTKLHGDLLRSRGAVRALSGNVQDALTDYQSAHDIFREAKIERSQAIALLDIGQIYWEAGDYERTLRYYEQAVELYNDDPGFALGNHNNLGEAYKMLQRYAEAEEEYGKALEAARELESPLLETRILSNLALVQVEQGNLAEASRTTNRAIALARNGEAADWRNFIYGVQARIAAERGDYRAAARYLDQTFSGTDLSETDLVYREFHELGTEVFERIGEPAKALAHLRAFQRLESQAQELVASASSQLMNARFDFANQNLRISQLKQGQLERDIKIERQQSQFRTNLLIGFVIAAAVVITLILVALFSIRRSRNEVRDANTQLTKVNVDLEHALKAKTDFLAMTSHEIRTPLNGILGTAQVLLADRAIDTGVSKRVQLIQSAGETMKALVDDLLDVAKMESGEVTLELEPTDLRAILRDAGELWRDKLKAKGLEFRIELGELPDKIETDGSRLRQIIFNLLSNAAKFTREGSVTLAAKMSPHSKELIVEVTDTGIGIAHEEQQEIFEAFHQVDNATTREFSGTGLGLSICKNLARALSGRIELSSTPGEGSTFTLIMPFVAINDDQAGDARSPISLSECRLALLEANPMKQAILTGLIEPHVTSILSCTDAKACETAINNGSVDHIVLDAASVAPDPDRLSELGSFLLKARSADIPTTLLFSPNCGLPQEVIETLQQTRLLLKPISGDELIAALEGHYSQHEQSKEHGYASAA